MNLGPAIPAFVNGLIGSPAPCPAGFEFNWGDMAEPWGLTELDNGTP